MKLISAIIKPFMLDEVRKALTAIGVEGLTVSEIKGYGRQQGQKEIYRGAEYSLEFVAKLRIEAVVPQAMAEEVIETIASHARTGRIGDGKIFVNDVAKVVRIRTGEQGEAAI